MILGQKNLFMLSLGLSMLLFMGCRKQNDSQDGITDELLKGNLFELVSSKSELSTFTELLKKTGYDKVISASKNFTVFAPNNTALAALDAVVVNDPVKLKLFVGNHITNQLVRVSDIKTSARVSMVNGKYSTLSKVALDNAIIDNAAIVSADKYAGNGLLQVMSGFIPALDNTWEVLLKSADIPVKQKSFMLSLFRNVYDLTNAVQVGINPGSGDPIYQAGTDSVYTNLFWNRVYDLKNEQKQFTLFVLTDAAWDAEVAKFSPYFVTNTTDSNTLVTSWNVVKDFAIDTLYNPSSIPDTVLSKFGTKLPVERSAIVKTIKTSNGIIYIMNKMNVLPASKFKPYLIQAENYNGYSNDRRSNTYFRDRLNPLTGKDFQDVLVLNHGLALFNLRYDLPEFPSVKYKAYWVAVNDFQTATFTQKLGIGSAVSTTFGYTTVALNDYSETYIGEFSNLKYAPVYNIYLTAANSTSNTANPIVCDYIKLVPAF